MPMLANARSETRTYVSSPKLRIAAAVLMGVAILAAAQIFNNQDLMSANISVPYTSGAANYELGGDWLYDPADVQRLNELPNNAERSAFQSARTDTLQEMFVLPQGWMFANVISQRVLPWMGDLEAAETLQVAVHLALTLWVVSRLTGDARKLLFLVGYGLNPFILHFATLPFYYYWQLIPTTLVALYILEREFRFGRWIVPLGALLSALVYVRSTTLAPSVILFALVVYRERRSAAVAVGGVIFVLGVVVQPFGPSGYWHSAYIGVGSYPNDYGISFVDQSGFDFYEAQTGVEVSGDPDGNLYAEPGFHSKYDGVMKDGFFDIASSDPLLIARNAVYNFGQVFSLGYFTASLTLSYLSSLAGFAFLGLLLWRRHYLIALVIAASAPASLFVPPIQAYMLGTLALTAVAVILVLESTPILSFVFSVDRGRPHSGFLVPESSDTGTA